MFRAPRSALTGLAAVGPSGLAPSDGWRNTLLFRLGPGLLAGITLADWLELLRDNRFALAPRALPRALAITWHAIRNRAASKREERRHGPDLEGVTVLPPVFILGHWRNGTTHLHNLLTVDDRFAFPNMYQALFPHTFLSTEAVSARMMSFFFPRRRPMDNIAWSLRSPQEDEFALCVSSLRSPLMGWVFPRRREHYDRYLTLRELPEAELDRWRQALWHFLKKLTWKYRRPLALKSPPHTCRIALLLEMFPDARFVHIHRDPYTVFQSSRWMFQVNWQLNGLQPPRLDDLPEWILRQYRVMYDLFFAERALIPKGRFHEVAFAELEKDPIGEMRRLYEALALPDLGPVEPALRGYLDSVAAYRKNEFPEVPAGWRRRIADAWQPCFEEWGYPD
jgi:omega-hydroxy-beta-dihydromenaquinone-9 sulfotransferase